MGMNNSNGLDEEPSSPSLQHDELLEHLRATREAGEIGRPLPLHAAVLTMIEQNLAITTARDPAFQKSA